MVFPYLEISCARVVSLLKMQTHHSYLPFYLILKKSSFEREFCVEKVTILWSEANFGPFQTPSDIAFVQKKSAAKKYYLFLQKAPS